MSGQATVLIICSPKTSANAFVDLLVLWFLASSCILFFVFRQSLKEGCQILHNILNKKSFPIILQALTAHHTPERTRASHFCQAHRIFHFITPEILCHRILFVFYAFRKHLQTSEMNTQQITHGTNTEFCCRI